MKNLIFKSFLFACLLTTNIAISCDEPIELTANDFAIELKVDYKGNLSEDALIEYHDKNGELQTIALTKNWKTSFKVPSGFNFYFRVKGKVDGRIEVESSIIHGDEVDKSKSRMNYDELTDFDIVREEIL